MKSPLLAVSLAAAVIGLSGCGETPTDKPATPAASTHGDAPAAVQSASDGAQKVADGAQQTAQKATAGAADLTGAAGAKVKEALAQAQALLSQGKLQEAQDSLKSLADLKLPADQQKMVDDLKAKIQQAMAAAKAGGGDATKAVQGLIPKIK